MDASLLAIRTVGSEEPVDPLRRQRIAMGNAVLLHEAAHVADREIRATRGKLNEFCSLLGCDVFAEFVQHVRRSGSSFRGKTIVRMRVQIRSEFVWRNLETNGTRDIDDLFGWHLTSLEPIGDRCVADSSFLIPRRADPLGEPGLSAGD